MCMVCSYLLAHFVSNCGTGSTVVDKGSLGDGSTCTVAIERHSYLLQVAKCSQNQVLRVQIFGSDHEKR